MKKVRMLATNTALRRDPTRTTTLRTAYARELRRRFAHIKRLIRLSVVDNDFFRLTDERQPLVIQARAPTTLAGPAQPYDFPLDQNKVEAFMQWLQEAIDGEILEVIERQGVRITQRGEFQNTYVRSAYLSGLGHADQEVARLGIEKLADEAIRAVFTTPIHIDALTLLYTRNFNELKGITEAMSQQISRVLVDGLSQGKGPREIARLLADRVDKIGITRATRLARTEIIRAHAEASLNRYQQYGIEEVGTLVEWLTASNPCEKCEAAAKHNNGVYTLEDARGLIPFHPNCRCAWAPYIPELQRNVLVNSLVLMMTHPLRSRVKKH
jgi:SPP1 gp7 family putative phage head morphogenesis protein